MSMVSLTAENERFLRLQVEAGRFATLDEALNSLIDKQRCWDDIVREKIAAGVADLEAGRYTDYDAEGLKNFFEDLKHGDLDAI